jgi:hypothetical protein
MYTSVNKNLPIFKKIYFRKIPQCFSAQVRIAMNRVITIMGGAAGQTPLPAS